MTVHLAIRQAARRTLLTAAGSLVGLAISDSALAQAWPVRTITAIVPFAAGSASDLMPRIVFDQVAKQLGQSIVIENRGGAGGTLGAATVAKAAPDGYTVLASGALGSGHALYPKLPYDPLRDFIPVIPFGQQPMVLVTAPSIGLKTLGDLIAAAKARPGALNFGSAGLGSTSHLAAERLRISAEFEAQHIPFRGATEVIAETLAGRLNFTFVPLATALPHINDGKLAALAVSSSKRAVDLPNVPTTTEAGIAGSAYNFWVGLYLPAKTPRDIVVRLHQETAKALQIPTVQDRLAKLGVAPMPMSLEQFSNHFRDDVEAHVRLVKAANIVAQQ